MDPINKFTNKIQKKSLQMQERKQILKQDLFLNYIHSAQYNHVVYTTQL